MIIISEYSKHLKKSAGSEYLRKMEEAAKLLGIQIINFEQGNIPSLEEVLYYKQNLEENEDIFWLGYVPKQEDYIAVEKILKKYKLNLINSPSEFSRSEYFDQFYPFIKDLTIPSKVANTHEEAIEMGKMLGFPLFLKGTIQSLKKYGWENCVANNKEELLNIFYKLKREYDFSLGKIILRKFVELFHLNIGGNGIPKVHEYRFFVFKQKILGYSFYWNGENPFQLTTQELELIKKKAILIAKRVNVTFISVDIAQTKNKEWIVIEIGDGQFSDIRNISPLQFWNLLLEK